MRVDAQGIATYLAEEPARGMGILGALYGL